MPEKNNHKNKNSRKNNGRRGRQRKILPPAISAVMLIDDIGAKGDGTAQLESLLVHIPYTAPGDKINARIIGDRGMIESIIIPSAQRVAPICSHFGDCGGCALQHVSASFLADWKLNRIKTALGAEGIFDAAVAPSPLLPTKARRRATFSVQRENDQVTIGFKARNTHRIVTLEECQILVPDIFDARSILLPLITKLPDDWKKFSIQINLCDTGLDVNLIGEGKSTNFSAMLLQDLAEILEGGAVARLSVNSEMLFSFRDIVVQFEGLPVRLPPGAFLQASVQGQQSLLMIIRNILGKAGIKNGALIADLFCGCGAFALPLSHQYEVYGADSHDGGINALLHAHAQQVSQQKGLCALHAEARDLFRQPLLPDELEKFAAVIFDPPRAGAPTQVKQLAQTSVPLIIGVSCNPASFARDARLLKKGGYTLTQVYLVDQFAFSPHIELVGTFEKKR